MTPSRSLFATHPSRFGRRFVLHDRPQAKAPSVSDDVRLFATTFAAGFLFVSVFLA